MHTGFVWFVVEFCDELLWTLVCNFGLLNEGISCPVELLKKDQALRFGSVAGWLVSGKRLRVSADVRGPPILGSWCIKRKNFVFVVRVLVYVLFLQQLNHRRVDHFWVAVLGTRSMLKLHVCVAVVSFGDGRTRREFEMNEWSPLLLKFSLGRRKLGVRLGVDDVTDILRLDRV